MNSIIGKSNPRHGLYKVILFIFTTSCAFSFINAEEYINDYTQAPKLKIFYGNHKEKKFPIDVRELIALDISGHSYTQEFDFTITKMKGDAPHLFIGVYKGLRVLILPNGCIYLHAHDKGYIAKSPKGIIKCNVAYLVKISYNNTTLLSQCVVTKKDDAQIVWDSEEILCDPLLSMENIHFASRHIAKDPNNSKSEIFWNEKEGAMTLCSMYKHYVLEAIVDNMKIIIKK